MIKKRILYMSFFWSIPFCAMQKDKDQIIQISLPTTKKDRYTYFELGRGLGTPDEIVESIKNPEIKHVVGSIAFGGYQFYKTIGHINKRLKLPDTDVEKLHSASINVPKRILAVSSTQKMIDAYVAAGGKVYVNKAHDKSWSFLADDKTVLESVVTSSNLSNRAKIDNYESAVWTTDSPLKTNIYTNITSSFALGMPYKGDGQVPVTPEKIKTKREKAFNSGIVPAPQDCELPFVMSSAKEDIQAFRNAALQEVIESNATDREGFISTMTVSRDLIDRLSHVDFPLTLAIDKSAVTQDLKDRLKKLAENGNLTILVYKDSGGISHFKIDAYQNNSQTTLASSTQNNASVSGNEFNQSVVTHVASFSPIKKYSNHLAQNTSWVPVSPTGTRIDAAIKPRKRKRIDEVSQSTKRHKVSSQRKLIFSEPIEESKQ